MPYSAFLCLSSKPPHGSERCAGCREVWDAVQIRIGIIPMMAAATLVRFEDWLAVERQADAKLGKPFQKVVRMFVVEF